MFYRFFGKTTSYEELSIKDIKNDIDTWIGYTPFIENFIMEAIKIIPINIFWNETSYKFQNIIEKTTFYFKTIQHDLKIIKSAIDNNCITQKEVTLLRNIGVNSSKYNQEFSKTPEARKNWSKCENPYMMNIKQLYSECRKFFISVQYFEYAADRLEDYMEKGQVINNNTMNFSAPITGSQIQQGTINSSLTMTIENNFDYDKVMDVLRKIHIATNSSDFQAEFADKAEHVKEIIAETIQMVQKKEKPSKIKKALTTLKDLSIGISGSIIATGICGLIAQLPIW